MCVEYTVGSVGEFAGMGAGLISVGHLGSERDAAVICSVPDKILSYLRLQLVQFLLPPPHIVTFALRARVLQAHCCW